MILNVLASKHPECYIPIHGEDRENIVLLTRWHKVVCRIITIKIVRKWSFFFDQLVKRISVASL